jgi:hypothetical protein
LGPLSKFAPITSKCRDRIVNALEEIGKPHGWQVKIKDGRAAKTTIKRPRLIEQG